VKDPWDYLAYQKLEFASAIDPSRPAILDREHARFVNYEIFFFADEAEMKHFDGELPAHAGILTDPVSRERFIPGDAPAQMAHDGRTWYFASDASLAAFVADPDKYTTPDYTMLMPKMPESPAAPDAAETGGG